MLKPIGHYKQLGAYPEEGEKFFIRTPFYDIRTGGITQVRIIYLGAFHWINVELQDLEMV